MAYMGMVKKEFRLPLCSLSDTNSKFIKGLLGEYGLLKKR
jgi:hypothetical protein